MRSQWPPTLPETSSCTRSRAFSGLYWATRICPAGTCAAMHLQDAVLQHVRVVIEIVGREWLRDLHQFRRHLGRAQRGDLPVHLVNRMPAAAGRAECQHGRENSAVAFIGPDPDARRSNAAPIRAPAKAPGRLWFSDAARATLCSLPRWWAHRETASGRSPRSPRCRPSASG